MRIALYSPYLDTAGGGERYLLSIAEVLKEEQVDLLIDGHLKSLNPNEILDKLIKHFNLDLKSVRTINAPLGKSYSFIQRIEFFKEYDVLIYFTDGSFFYPTAKKNFIHIQTPIVGQANNLIGKIKLSKWDLAIFNSNFTKEHSKLNWPIKGVVVYPPIDTDTIKPLTKKKIILTVGRFFGFLKEKKHQIMIDSFKNMYNNWTKDWSFYLVGSASEGDEDYITQLNKSAKGLPIYIKPNLSYKELLKLYGEASIYWHAMGYGESDPTKMEHFGITTVEAMAGGAVPVVINLGGQKEIVEDGISGLLWNNTKELIEKTSLLIRDEKMLKEMSQNAIKRTQNFSKKRFAENIRKLVYEK